MKTHRWCPKWRWVYADCQKETKAERKRRIITYLESIGLLVGLTLLSGGAVCINKSIEPVLYNTVSKLLPPADWEDDWFWGAPDG